MDIDIDKLIETSKDYLNKLLALGASSSPEDFKNDEFDVDVGGKPQTFTIENDKGQLGTGIAQDLQGSVEGSNKVEVPLVSQDDLPDNP
jgi:hypothetical protein